jgi:hypothetical protein
MGFKLTYSDGQADDYDNSTQWAVEDGVLKMGREAGTWTVLVSPSHWATIEVSQDEDASKDQPGDDEEESDEGKSRDGDHDEDDDHDEDR